MLRFFLLRFLPRRLVPFLFLLEIFRLVRRWQTRNDPVVDPRGRRAVAGYPAEKGTLGPTRVDRRG